ncbi:MAG TPA: P-loop NTPase [Chloroflexota bacterium]
MPEQIKILLVGQSPELLADLRRAFNTFADTEIVGDAAYGPVALTWARTLAPEVVFVAVDDPATRSLATIQTLAQGNPPWTVVGLVSHFERDLFRKLVLAGARDVVVLGAGADELHRAVVAAWRADLSRRSPATLDSAAPAGTIVSLFGVKGGVGKTTLATNIAVALAQETLGSTALVDLDLPFGDIALMMDVKPERDVLDVLDETILEDTERLQTALTRGPEGVYVLAAPLAPDVAAAVDGARIARLLHRLAGLYDFVVVDSPAGISEVTAAILDAAGVVLLVTTPEVPTLRRTHACIRMLQGLGFPTDKVKLVLNRASSRTRITAEEAEDVLGQPIVWQVANDYAAMKAAAFGQPVVISQPRTQLSRAVRDIARTIGGVPLAPPKRSGWRAWLPSTLAAGYPASS